MEAVYLLCSIIYNSVTSSILSIHLLYRFLLRAFSTVSSSSSSPSHPLNEEEEEEVALYEGSVWHERRRPVHHSFRYPVRYALIYLDRAKPDTLLNHFSADQARKITATTGPVFLLTIPKSVGYEQNPLSVYYCYDLEGSIQCLKKCIAEVTNTPWGERVSFIFNPDSDLVAKPLHVSPFMDMLGNWKMKANAPGEHLFLAISVQHPELGDYFTATLTAKRVASTSEGLIFFWLMPQKVAVWIYWQALKLWWKNVPFVQHPRYFNSKYREEASMRDRKLQCPQVLGKGEDSCAQFESSYSACSDGINSRDRWCVWRDARWPWS
ncbi:uncharacterized protein LOC122641025 [Telopea speciosissima]|uniref:uncharacterized protein LOC122641025 n=1 Tax=Telopea speciosissima TaxID=54955 RepID=UPI001CC54EEB|nr:uncharacterized protein LOC122641025 [Telopea speciosissima]